MVSPSRPTVGTLREAAQRAVDAGSLRSVAKQVGLSTMGLHGFLQGRAPRPANEEKLRKWYARMRLERARGWVDELLAELPEAKRAGALDELVRAVEEVFRGRGERPPGWVTMLKGGVE